MRLSRAKHGVLFVLPLALVACGGGEEDAEAAPAAEPMSQAGADAMRNAFVDSYMRRDPQGAAVFYADDAVMYHPDGTAANGREAIVAAYQNMMASGMDSLGLAVASFEATGDAATERGTWVMRQLDPQTKEAVARTTGEYLVVYGRQADGTFKIVKDSVWQTGEITEPR